MPFDGLTPKREAELDVLLRMREALSRPGAWCRGIALYGGHGHCLVMSARTEATTAREADSVVRLLADNLPEPYCGWPLAWFMTSPCRVIVFNDMAARTQADVLAVVDRAIEAAW